MDGERVELLLASAPTLAMTRSTTLLIVTLALLLVCLVPGTAAFGAGEIPSYSARAKDAYRHGTIEQVLETIAKVAGSHHGIDASGLAKGLLGAVLGGGSIGSVASSVKLTNKSNFSGLDIKRVYFGNWLRDYSQAVDIAGLSKLNVDSIVLLIMCLGFMTFGYATDEFEITKEKLGVYLCTEHIDNPKGYGEGQDARQYDQRLRPPVQDRELEIDDRNGMKRYIASEGEGFDTSTECITRHLRKCIEAGRRGGDNDRYEAYRELGTALHTLEDFLAHSNYLELALNKLGHRDVFCHVGDNVRVRAPNGEMVPPIVTGTFGSADFMASILGEVGDRLSSSTVDDLNDKFKNAHNQAQNQDNKLPLQQLLAKIPSENKDDNDLENKMQNVEKIKQDAINLDMDKIAPGEVQKIFLQVLQVRDDIFKTIEGVLEKVGLSDLIDELATSLSVLVLTTIEPYVAPIVKKASEAVGAGADAIVQQEDQLVVFNDPNASDPTHSVLSKDHYDVWLNEAGGQAAIAVVKFAVPLVVEAWYDQNANVDDVIKTILQAIHHPYWARGDSRIQSEMLDVVRRWLDGKSQQEQRTILNGLTKESVKEGKNKREDSETYGVVGHRHGHGGGHGGHGGHGNAASSGAAAAGAYGENRHQQTFNQNTLGGRLEQRQQHFNAPQASESYGGGGRQHEQSESRTSYGSGGNQYGAGRKDEQRSSYNTSNEYGRTGANHGLSENQYDSQNAGGGYRRQQEEHQSFGQSESRYGQAGRDEYGSGRRHEQESYGRRDDDNDGRRRHEENSYGRQEEHSSYGRQVEHSSYGRDNDRGGRQEYGRNERQGGGYGGGAERHEERSSGYGGSGGFEDRIGRMNINESSGFQGGRNESGGYGRHEGGYGQTEGRGYGGHDENRFGGGEERRHGGFGGGEDSNEHHGRRNEGRRSGEYGGGHEGRRSGEFGGGRQW